MPAVQRVFVVLCLCGTVFAGDIGLIRIGERWDFLMGYTEPPTNGAVRWFEPNYRADWSRGPSGFTSGIGYAQATVPEAYGGQYQTIYFRKEFIVEDPSSIADLLLRIEYDDGFVVYLNGLEVARRGVAGVPGLPVPVTATATFHSTDVGELIPVNAGIPFLRPGTNLLAIQLLGSGPFDRTMRFAPELLANIVRGPYVQNTTVDSTQIVWNTQSTAASAIEFGRNLGSMALLEVGANTNLHVATIRGLEPDTDYFYRLINRFGTKQTYSDWRSFRTFKPAGKVNFNVIGDSGWGSLAQLKVAEQMDLTPADFTMHVGDMVYYAITHGNADLRLFSVYAEEMSRRPWFLAVGNHESYLDPRAALDVLFLPTNNATGTEHFYSFDHGDVHFAVAYTDLQAGARYEPGSPQYQWLEADLANSTKPWKLLFFHHTWRTSSSHQIDDYDLNTVLDSLQMDQSLAQLARAHGVSIIFHGHDHCYERLAPNGGPISIISGGGGAAMYPMSAPHPEDVQFHARHHFLRVTVEGDEARVEAVDLDGVAFDTVHVRKDFPGRMLYQAELNTPLIESSLGDLGDMDGNFPGQVFDFIGKPVGSKMGKWSSAGRLFVNNDRTNLFLGFDEVMVSEGEELLVFLEVPGLAGRTNMAGIGNGIFDPGGEAVDTLDFLENVGFTHFRPSIALVLGSEHGDAMNRNLFRGGQLHAGGQGAYYLSDGIPGIPEQRLTQFNRSPQLAPMFHEENADFVEVALPLNWLGGLKPGDVIRIAAVVGLENVDTNSSAQTREIDSGGIACAVTQQGGVTWLEGIEVRLAGVTDFDGDLLTDEEEGFVGTDWRHPDSDNDGMPDGWEVRHSLHPGMKDANADADGDGSKNGAEYRAGTDPKSAESKLMLRAERIGAGYWLMWNSVPGKGYSVQVRDDLEEPFRDVPDFPRIASAPEMSYPIDVQDAAGGSRYYRLLVAEQPGEIE